MVCVHTCERLTKTVDPDPFKDALTMKLSLELVENVISGEQKATSLSRIEPQPPSKNHPLVHRQSGKLNSSATEPMSDFRRFTLQIHQDIY
jgi:hypothetical protein